MSRRSKAINKRILITRKYMTILVGAILMAISINIVYEPMGMVTGGVSGLAIVVKKLTEPFIEGGLPIWLFNTLINIPLFLIAFVLKGKKFLMTVLFGTVCYILALMIVPIYSFKYEDTLLASIFGGVIGGVGIGLVFSTAATTGGSDLIATLIHDFKKHYSVPQILIIVDGIIIVIGAIVFGVGNALYALIAVFITAKVSDGILSGLKYAKMAYIISEEYVKIAEAIMQSLDRGVTSMSVTGMYSNKDKNMLFCVVTKKEIVKIIEISQKIDSKSFVIISDVREVMGEGFIEYRQ